MNTQNDTSDWVYLLRADSNNLAAIVTDAYKVLDRIEHTITVMETQDMFDAAPYWRDEKYLYLIFPQVNGERERRYIGSAPDNIREALTAIDRYKKWKQYNQEFAEYQRNCRAAVSAIENAVKLLKDKPSGW